MGRHCVAVIGGAGRRAGPLALLVLLIAVTALGACSGGDKGTDGTTGRTRWSAKANEVCTRTAAAPVPLPMGAPPDLDRLPAQERGRLVESFRKAGDDARELAGALADVGGSSKDQAALLEHVRTDARLLAQAADATSTSRLAGVVFAGARLRLTGNAVADRLNLDACRDRFGVWSQGSTPSAAPLRVDVLCLKDPDFLDRLDTPDAGTVDASDPVVCETRHDVERYLTFDPEASIAKEYPGQILLAEQAAAQCDASFKDAAGRPAVSDVGTYVAPVPDSSAWQAGRREISCIRFDPSGTQLTRKTASGSSGGG